MECGYAAADREFTMFPAYRTRGAVLYALAFPVSPYDRNRIAAPVLVFPWGIMHKIPAGRSGPAGN